MQLFSDKTWAAIGRVALLVSILGIVGILANIVKVYEFFAPSGPNLVGFCSYSEYLSSPDIDTMMMNIYNTRSGKYTEGTQKALSTYTSEIEKDIPKSDIKELDEINRRIRGNNIEKLLKDVLNDIIPSSLNKSSNPYPGILDFYITNKGNELARDVAISLPFEGKAYVLSRSTNPRVVEVKRTIELGNIRQNDNIRALLWSTEVPNLKHESFIRLTHSSGVGTISFFISEVGPVYTIVRDHWSLVVLCFILLLGGSLIGAAFLLDHFTGTSLITTRASE